MNDLWQPLLLSLRIASAATVLAAVVGVPLAFVMARRKFFGKTAVEALLTLPLVLPPTVVGYLLIITFGKQGWIGAWLDRWFGYTIVFRFEGAVLAAAVVALPLLYMPSKAAFASIERELEDVARMFGATWLQMFWHVSLPLARRGIGSGMLLAFARALGEFGATMMVFGFLPRRQTLPISIYLAYEQGQLATSAAAVIALTLVSAAVIIIYNRSLGRGE